MTTVLKYGKEEIQCPAAVLAMADRLAAVTLRDGLAFDRPLSEILGTIYLMGFVHAADTMNRSKVGKPE